MYRICVPGCQGACARRVPLWGPWGGPAFGLVQFHGQVRVKAKQGPGQVMCAWLSLSDVQVPEKGKQARGGRWEFRDIVASGWWLVETRGRT